MREEEKLDSSEFYGVDSRMEQNTPAFLVIIFVIVIISFLASL